MLNKSWTVRVLSHLSRFLLLSNFVHSQRLCSNLCLYKLHSNKPKNEKYHSSPHVQLKLIYYIILHVAWHPNTEEGLVSGLSIPPVYAVKIKTLNKEGRKRENHYMPRSVLSQTECRIVQSPPH